MQISLRNAAKVLTYAGGIAALTTAGFHTPLVHAVDREAYTKWADYEGGVDSRQYSGLGQINKSNAAQLQQVWFYPADFITPRFGSNPIIVGSTMYVIGKNNSIVALDGATGREIWVHDNRNPVRVSDRGVSYWESKDKSDRRILFTADNVLYAIDARSGKTIDSFGDHGCVDLRDNLGRDPQTIRQIESATPGRVFENLLILGSATGEEYNSPPGDIRAYDVRSGKLAWTFHTVPHPGEFGYDTWPKDAWKYIGGTNDWGGMAIDEKRGIAYFPLGSPTYDFYGADRLGANLFSDSLLALDVRTGKYLWHYQTVHHDLWDYDLTTSPKLLTVRHDGKMVDVVAQPGKTGFLYVFDRVTGKPLWPIEERPVPASDMAGEKAWPTQPFPTMPPPFARQKFTADEINPYIADAAERAEWHDKMVAAHNGLFTPPDLGNTIEMPGNSGGGNWGSAAVDPKTGFVYVEAKEAPTMLQLTLKPPKREVSGPPANQGRAVYIQNCQVCHTSELKGQPPLVPSLVDIVGRIGADRVRSTVANGLSPMPAFPDLSSRELDSLIAYLTNPAAAHLSTADLERLTRPAPPPPLAKEGAASIRYWSGYGYMIAKNGLPAITPPWTTLTAYDLNQGTIRWQIPLGEVSQLAAKGITGVGSVGQRGGITVTAGGLIFSGTRSDSTIRAYDKDTGKVLWEKHLPGSPEGIPAVYEIDGREYVVMSAIGHGAPLADPDGAVPAGASKGQQETQGYYVFALPRN
jgi:quinoprotein glucose dehydrogenase